MSTNLLVIVVLVVCLVGADRTLGDEAMKVLVCHDDGNPGQCMTAADCGAFASFVAAPNKACQLLEAGLRCCVLAPNVSDNPAVPAGWQYMQQAQVSANMTQFAVDILHDPRQFPRFATVLRAFTVDGVPDVPVLARVEWHPPDFQNAVVHRGVTLYLMNATAIG